MDTGTYNAVLQVVAAFVIFVIGYMALFLLITVCLLLAEAVRQGVIFARASLGGQVLPAASAVLADSAPAGEGNLSTGWAHKYSGSLVGAHKH
jgi:hypothetical protein